MPKGGNVADIEAGVLAALQQATGILQAKAPDQLANYRTVIMQACEQVAGAQRAASRTPRRRRSTRSGPRWAAS